MTSATFHLDHDLESIDPMVLLLTDAVRSGLPDDAVGRFGIATSEALTNLVLHAKNSKPDAKIRVVLTQDKAAIRLSVFDPEGADAFDLRDYATDLAMIDATAEGGRGLGLILACADHVSYGPEDGQNRLELVFNR